MTRIIWKQNKRTITRIGSATYSAFNGIYSEYFTSLDAALLWVTR